MNWGLGHPRLSLRLMLESDLFQIMEIERAAYRFPWPEHTFRDCLRAGYCSWILQREDRVCAYGIIAITVDAAHILNLCVCPGMRRMGLGRTMLEHLLWVASDHKAAFVQLEVRPSNQAAIRLYQSCGFLRIGWEEGYYRVPGGYEDALLLSRLVHPVPGRRLERRPAWAWLAP